MKLEYTLINGKIKLKDDIIYLNTRETFDENNLMYIFGGSAAYEHLNMNNVKEYIKNNVIYYISPYTDNDFQYKDNLSELTLFIFGQMFIFYDSPGMSFTSSNNGYISKYGSYGLMIMGNDCQYFSNIDGTGDYIQHDLILFAESDGVIPVKYTNKNGTTKDLSSITIEEGKIYFFKVDDENKDIILDEVITVPTVTEE